MRPVRSRQLDLAIVLARKVEILATLDDDDGIIEAMREYIARFDAQHDPTIRDAVELFRQDLARRDE